MKIIYITFEDVGKAIEFNCALCAAAEKVTFDSVLNSKYCIHAIKFWWPTQKLLLLHHSPVAPWGPYGPL
jgi:hypothetical protein